MSKDNKNLKSLFEPIKISNIEIKNRVVMAPMGARGLYDIDGSLGSRAIDYYVERAKGEVGLIITGVFFVTNDIEKTKITSRNPFISPLTRASFAELAETLHALGTKIFVQLTAGYGRVFRPHLLQEKPVSSSSIPNYWNPDITCRELSTTEIEGIVKAFGSASQILKEADIDGIELHGHEGYLFDQFTTKIWNNRNDKYGGDLSGRLRFPLEVLNEIKRQAGSDYPVQYRFGLKHYIKGLNAGALPGETFIEAGRDIEEGLNMAKLLEEVGFDSLHVDAGCYDSWYWPHPPGYQEYGCMVDMAAKVKKVVNIPVIAVGRLDEPEISDQVIRNGKADMIAIGRGLLADPFWAKKVKEEQLDHIRPCLGCHDGCSGRIHRGRPLSCAVNPACGRERSYSLQNADIIKSVLIVGGGIAGLEAARVAALRGHQVMLYEKSDLLGGHVIAASVPDFKKEMRKLLEWYKTQLSASKNVKIYLEHEVTLEFIQKIKPDVIIFATGSTPTITKLPKIDKENVVTAIDFFLGKKHVGDIVIIMGGGLLGCETAIWLAQRGKKVTIVEALDELMSSGRIPVPYMNKIMMLDLLKYYNVNILTNSKLIEFADANVRIINKSFQENSLPANTLVIATGLKSDQELYFKLVNQLPNVYLIGDARETSNIMNAIWDAYEVARTI